LPTARDPKTVERIRLADRAAKRQNRSGKSAMKRLSERHSGQDPFSFTAANYTNIFLRS
jgi:hypothetical protein